jgi:hypothetical protein
MVAVEHLCSGVDGGSESSAEGGIRSMTPVWAELGLLL